MCSQRKIQMAASLKYLWEQQLICNLLLETVSTQRTESHCYKYEKSLKQDFQTALECIK